MGTQFNLKSVVFLGRQCMVLCQNENGPCPLLAIANALLLQNVIFIHPDKNVITMNELIVIVANTFVEKGIAQGREVESRAGLMQQQLDSVLNTLPNLGRGLDLNIHFTGATDFEFTEEISVFDALDIPLLHGWVLDPQDAVTANVIERNQSYNHLMYKLVEYRSLLETFNTSTNTVLEQTSAPVEGQAQREKDRGKEGEHDVNPVVSDITAEKDSDIVEDFVRENSIESWDIDKSTETEVVVEVEVEAEHVGGNDSPYVLVTSDGEEIDTEVTAEQPPTVITDESHNNSSGSDLILPLVLVPADSLPLPLPLPHQPEDPDPIITVNKSDENRSLTYENRRQQWLKTLSLENTVLLQEGEVIDNFLSTTASQLTYVGLLELYKNIRERQFAVFFRNNHFSTIFCLEGRLFLLVTDLGYQHEQSVVWELLDGIDG